MNENKRYKLFKLILIITILNVFGILRASLNSTLRQSSTRVRAVR